MPYKLVMLLSTTVNYLLLLATARLCNQVPNWPRVLLGAGLGGVYATACLLPGFSFLGGVLWRLVSLLLVGALVFGWGRKTLRPLGAFCLLSLVLGGAVSNNGGKASLLCACGLLALCYLVKNRGTGQLVPVELHYGGKKVRVKALHDTGNLLHDPISGTPVLVIGARAAQELTGLTAAQLQMPLRTMGAIPGLRLIPYRAVGSSGFLLGLKLQNVRIGSWQGSRVVAFAPEGLDGNGQYEALTGGVL